MIISDTDSDWCCCGVEGFCGPPVWQPDEVLKSPKSLEYQTKNPQLVWSWRCDCLTACAACCPAPSSPHPVKPLTATMLAEEKRTEGRSVLATGLEKLRSTINPGRSGQLGEQEADKKKVRHGADDVEILLNWNRIYREFSLIFRDANIHI